MLRPFWVLGPFFFSRMIYIIFMIVNQSQPESMKIFKSAILLLVILIFTISCKKNDTTLIQVYNLDEVSSKTEIKYSDFLDNIHLVKLEMVADYPVSSSYLKQWIGGKYILLISRKMTLQYTSDGQFVRELIRNGKGPSEYGEIDYYDVDEQKEIFYFYDHESPGRIRRIDLRSGELLESIKLPDDERWLLAGFVIHDDRLLCFTNNFSEADYRYFYLSENGDVEFGFSKQAYLDDRPMISLTPYLNECRGEVTYTQVRDTLFRLVKDTLEPEMIIRVDNYFSPGTGVNKGSSPQLILNGKEHRLLKNTEVEFSQSERGMSFDDHGTTYFLIDRKQGSITQATHFYNDYFDIEEEEVDFLCNDGFAYVVIEAIELMSLLAEAPINENANPETKERISSLKKTINENDNPYLLIGKLK